MALFNHVIASVVEVLWESSHIFEMLVWSVVMSVDGSIDMSSFPMNRVSARDHLGEPHVGVAPIRHMNAEFPVKLFCR